MTDTTQAGLTALLRADGELVTERLDHWAATAGDRPFFHYGEDGITLTYAEFARRTDAIAGNLAAHGIAKGDRVSVFCANPFASALMMFGIWKAGAVYCPVNFAYTGHLLTYQLRDTAPAMVVTDPALLPALNAVADDLDGAPTVAVYAPPAGAHDHVATREDVSPRLPELAWAELQAPAERPPVTVEFDDPANIIYTSGTTGPAKGVVQPYRWLAQYTFNLRRALTTDDVIYNDLPLYHVGGAIANIARAAWAGCEVAVWNRFSSGDFWRRIASRGATTAILLDVMIPWLMNAPAGEDDRRNTLNKVHMQPLPAHHAEVAKRFGIDFVTAGFGQTESGAPLAVVIEETEAGGGTPPELYRGRSHAEIRELTTALGMPVLRGDEVRHKGLMGLPSPFLEVAVLDEHDRYCADGEPGQLAVRPRLPGLVPAGYLGKPEATVAATRNLWFHTGDAAVRGADGMFCFVDRLGDRIRVRGENLSSFQVEEILNRHPAVQLSAVFSIPSREGGEDDVVAYVVSGDGKVLTEQDVHEFAAGAMPKYMRPRHVRIVPDLPRTPTNKVEKYRLRARILDELKEEGR
ncbi:AMP-binding protein [Amycolatopsis rhizosphaerae]|uniref:AMP-binding protein n=1 Tax=Amycolatopsis rhizosphaerae TaxID=2053003 RepID=A0A558CW50_9PSEU|nr:AMP-binding protein [Amycolatopsis rhizosphaerae]TVT53001.1 AMP-binding protein [Amycolatopsis rhizosphaerae]